MLHIALSKFLFFSRSQEEREGEWYVEGTSEEVGIDVPSEKPPQVNSDSTTTIPTSTSSMSISGASMLASSQNQPTQSSQPTKSVSLHSLNSQSSSPRGSTTRLSTQTSIEQEQPSRGSMRARAATVATNSLSRGNRGRSPGPNNYQRAASPLLNAIGLARADGKLHVQICTIVVRSLMYCLISASPFNLVVY